MVNDVVLYIFGGNLDFQKIKHSNKFVLIHGSFQAKICFKTVDTMDEDMQFKCISKPPDATNRFTIGSTGEATDKDMLAPDLLPHPPQTSQVS